MQHSRIARCTISLLIYITLALGTTWPVMSAPSTSFVMGTTNAVTVPLFNVWTIWWNADRATHGFSGYWNAPIFHPTTEAFAFSELQLTTLIVAPLLWNGGSRVLAYNVYLWLTLVLNGVLTERCLRVMRVNRWLALCGGAAIVLLPIIHWQLDVIQLAPIWGVLWCWTACWQFMRDLRLPLSTLHSPLSTSSYQSPSVRACRRGLEVGLAVSLTFHACGHHGLFLGLLLAIAGWVLPKRWLDRRVWIALVVSAVVVGMLVGPFAWHMAQVMKTHRFVRTEGLIGSLSALPQDYLGAPGLTWFDFGSRWCRDYWRLSPGSLKLVLAGLGLGLGLWRRRTRRFSLFLLLTVAVAFALSLGTNLKLGSHAVWPILAQHVPGLGQVRNVFRFAFFVQIAAVLLSMLWLHWLGRLVQWKLRRWSRTRRLIQVAVLLLGVIAVAEVRPAMVTTATIPDPAANQLWMDYIKQQTPAGSAIVCLPFAQGYECGHFQDTTRWMFLGTYHGVPMVNGYSGFFPADYFETHAALNSIDNYGNGLSKLAANQVHFAVVTTAKNTEPPRFYRYGAMQLDLVFVDPIGVSIYRLRRVVPGN